MPNNTLSYLTHKLKKIDLSTTKSIFPLPNDLVFIADTRDNFVSYFNISNGQGHEPYMINKMLSFTQEGDHYIEIGAHYGDFSLQISHKIGPQGKVYAFEPSSNLFECFSTSISLNGITNIILENLAVMDKPQKINFFENPYESLGNSVTITDTKYNKNIPAINLDSYFEGKESTINVIRLDAEGNECQILRGAANILNSSHNLIIFIEWQAPLLSKFESQLGMQNCLSNLSNKGFIFLDILEFNQNCHYSNYQLSEDDILKFNMLEFLAIREDNPNLIKHPLYNDSSKECLSRDRPLILYTIENNVKEIQNLLDKEANIDYIHPIGATALYIASQEGYLETTTVLLEAGANTEIKANNGLSPLYISSVNNDSRITELLLEHGANTETSISSGSTPLYAASYFGYNNIIELLLSHGANKTVQVDGVSALQVALQNDYQSTAQLLAGGQKEFCQQIQNTEFETKYIEICGETKIELLMEN